MNKRHYDVLDTRQIEAADNFLDGEHAHEVPLVIKTEYENVKKELRRLSRLQKQKQEEHKRLKQQKEDTGNHTAVTGLSVGGVKVWREWEWAEAKKNERIGQEL